MEAYFGKTGHIKFRLKLFGIAFLLMFYSFMLKASVEEYNKAIYNYYISNEITEWENVIQQMNADYKRKNNPDLLYEATVTIYGYIGYCIGTGQKDKAIKYIEMGEGNMNLLQNNLDKKPEILALKSAFYGFRIAVNPVKSVYYGPKSLETIDNARQLSPHTPQVLLESANVKYYTPEIFGGSKTEAITYYEKAIAGMELHGMTEKNWLYLSAMTALARAYDEMNMDYKANLTYKKILQTEPNYSWVKDDLYPDFKRRYKA